MLYAFYALALTNIALAVYILVLSYSYYRERQDLLNRIMARDYRDYLAKEQPSTPGKQRNFISYYQNNPQATPFIFIKKKVKKPSYMPDDIDETEDTEGG